MKKTIRRIFAIVLIVTTFVCGVYMWHTSEMKSLCQRLSEEQARKDLMSQRIQEIVRQLSSSKAEERSLLAKVDELFAEDAKVFNSEAIMEEVLEIGEFATVEYRYTNAGTLDGSKKFSFVDLTIPFSGKTAVVTMDGVIKVGVEMSQVEITTDESAKIISVVIPEAKILSNELFEDTMAVYVEEESLFSRISLDDSSSIRADIKAKAQQNALDNGLLDQAREKAGEIVVYLIETAPSVKDTYTIVVR